MFKRIAIPILYYTNVGDSMSYFSPLLYSSLAQTWNGNGTFDKLQNPDPSEHLTSPPMMNPHRYILLCMPPCLHFVDLCLGTCGPPPQKHDPRRVVGGRGRYLPETYESIPRGFWLDLRRLRHIRNRDPDLETGTPFWLVVLIVSIFPNTFLYASTSMAVCHSLPHSS